MLAWYVASYETPSEGPLARRYYTADAYVLTRVPRLSLRSSRPTPSLEVHAGGLPQVVKPDVMDPRHLVKGRFNVGDWPVFVQEHTLGVQPPLLLEISEDPVHGRDHGDRPRFSVFVLGM